MKGRPAKSKEGRKLESLVKQHSDLISKLDSYAYQELGGIVYLNKYSEDYRFNRSLIIYNKLFDKNQVNFESFIASYRNYFTQLEDIIDYNSSYARFSDRDLINRTKSQRQISNSNNIVDFQQCFDPNNISQILDQQLNGFQTGYGLLYNLMKDSYSFFNQDNEKLIITLN